MQFHLVFSARFGFDLQHYLTVIGKLKRIADKIHHDLSQTQWITEEQNGDLRMNTACQLNAFLVRTRRKYSHSIFKRIAKVEADQVKLQLARFDLRKIEKV